MFTHKKIIILTIVLGFGALAGPAFAGAGHRTTCKTSRVGTIVNWPQTKVIMKMRRLGFIKTKIPKLMRRTKKVGLHTEVCTDFGTPKAALQQVEREVKQCFKLAMKAGGATLIASSPKAVPVFLTTFKGCAATKVKQLKHLLRIKPFTKSTLGHWKSV